MKLASILLHYIGYRVLYKMSIYILGIEVSRFGNRAARKGWFVDGMEIGHGKSRRAQRRAPCATGLCLTLQASGVFKRGMVELGGEA
jgi:hypothetical protein